MIKQLQNLLLLNMNKKKNLIFFLAIIFLTSCSFDNKTGIWSGNEEEKGRLSELEKQQKQIIDIDKIYSSDSIYSKRVSLLKNINLTEPKKNLGWQMQGLNLQNGEIFQKTSSRRNVHHILWKHPCLLCLLCHKF